MNTCFTHRYDCLLQELTGLKSKALAPLKEMEARFRICLHYWSGVRASVLQTSLAPTGEEMHFFKHIKLSFTSELHNYHLLCYAHLFEPEEDGEEKAKF